MNVDSIYTLSQENIFYGGQNHTSQSPQTDVIIKQRWSNGASGVQGEWVEINLQKLSLSSEDFGRISTRLAEVKQCRDAYHTMHPMPTPIPMWDPSGKGLH